MKDLDHKETTATLEQMKQKDRLVKLELTNKLLAGRKEVMDTCLEQYKEVENMFATMLGQKAKQIIENMPKTKSSKSIGKQEAEEIETWRVMVYQEIEDYHKNIIPNGSDPNIRKRIKLIKENKERRNSLDNDILKEIEENKIGDMMHRTFANK